MNARHENNTLSSFELTFACFEVSYSEKFKIVSAKCCAELLSPYIRASKLVLCNLSQVVFQVGVCVRVTVRKVAALIVTEIEGEAEGVVISDWYFVWSLESTFVVADVGARSLPHKVSRLADSAS